MNHTSSGMLGKSSVGSCKTFWCWFLKIFVGSWKIKLIVWGRKMIETKENLEVFDESCQKFIIWAFIECQWMQSFHVKLYYYLVKSSFSC